MVGAWADLLLEGTVRRDQAAAAKAGFPVPFLPPEKQRGEPSQKRGEIDAFLIRQVSEHGLKTRHPAFPVKPEKFPALGRDSEIDAAAILGGRDPVEKAEAGEFVHVLRRRGGADAEKTGHLADAGAAVHLDQLEEVHLMDGKRRGRALAKNARLEDLTNGVREDVTDARDSEGKQVFVAVPRGWNVTDHSFLVVKIPSLYSVTRMKD